MDVSLDGLMRLIEGRKTEKKEGSYTTYLFEKGIDKIFFLCYDVTIRQKRLQWRMDHVRIK